MYKIILLASVLLSSNLLCAQSYNFYVAKDTRCLNEETPPLAKNYYFEIDREKLDFRNLFGIKRDSPILDQDITVEIAGVKCRLKVDTESKVLIQIPKSTEVERIGRYTGESYSLRNDTEFLTYSRHFQDGQLINYPIPLLKSSGNFKGEQYAWLNEKDAKQIKRQKDKYIPERVSFSDTSLDAKSESLKFKTQEDTGTKNRNESIQQ